MHKAYRKFTSRMAHYGLAVHPWWRNGSGLLVSRTFEDGRSKSYHLKQVDNPTAEYLMEHERKALAWLLDGKE